VDGSYLKQLCVFFTCTGKSSSFLVNFTYTGKSSSFLVKRTDHVGCFCWC